MNKKLGQLAGNLRETRHLKEQAREYGANASIMPEIILEVCQRADVVLERFFKENEGLVNSKLAPFDSLLQEIDQKARLSDNPDKSVRGLLTRSLHKIILQEYRVIGKKYAADGDFDKLTPEEVQHVFTDEKLEKICQGMLIEFYRALKISQQYELTPTNTAILLGNLYKIDPNNLTRLLNKYRSKEYRNAEVKIPDSIIVQHAIKSNNADAYLERMASDHKRLKKLYKNNPLVTESIIQRYVNDSNPDDSIEKFLARVEAARSIPQIGNSVPLRIIREQASENPNNYLNVLETFVKNLKYINEKYSDTQVHADAKEYFATRSTSFFQIDALISEYLKNCVEVEGVSYKGKTFGEYGYGYIIRSKVHRMGTEKMKNYLISLVESIVKILNDPRLPEITKSKTTLENIVLNYGSKDLLDKCIKIAEYQRKLTSYFSESKPRFKEILEKYSLNIIRLSMISPIKSFEENRDFFEEKIQVFIDLFEKAKQRSENIDKSTLWIIYHRSYTEDPYNEL